MNARHLVAAVASLALLFAVVAFMLSGAPFDVPRNHFATEAQPERPAANDVPPATPTKAPIEVVRPQSFIEQDQAPPPTKDDDGEV